MPALRLPSFSSRSMRAREDAVSAVSLPAKKNESSSRQSDDRERSASQSSRRGHRIMRELLGEEGADLGGIDVGRDEGLRRCRAPG